MAFSGYTVNEGIGLWLSLFAALAVFRWAAYASMKDSIDYVQAPDSADRV